MMDGANGRAESDGRVWCIVRCTSVKTLELAKSLGDAGFEAWAPIESVILRARRGHARQEIVVPMMPGFVFVETSRLVDLIALSRSPSLIYRVWDAELRRTVTRGHPYFRMFRPFSDHDTIPDAQLAHLRKLDGLRRPKGPLRTWSEGDRVRLTDGAYSGLRGTVRKYSGEQTTVELDGWMLQPTVSTRLLHPELDIPADENVSSTSRQALSAKAA
jgi:transcription antitermination factor NusG